MLRGILSIGVLFGHAICFRNIVIYIFKKYGSVDYVKFYEPLINFLTFNHGNNFVKCFFILSGYLMGKLFYDGKYELNVKGVKRFYKSRFLRIVPLLFITDLVYFVFSSEPVDKNPINLFNDLFFISNITGCNINGVAWSIAYEMQFYLIFPFIFILFRNVSRKNMVLVSLSIVILFSLNYLSDAATYIHTLLSQLFLFIIGFSINIILRLTGAKRFRFSGLTAALSFAAAQVLSFIFYVQHMDKTSVVIMALLFSISIFSLELPSETDEPGSGKSFISKLLTYFGIISYGVYLWHPLVLSKYLDLSN
ncbi:MAG: acyltransferase [Candidatus Magnetominusculus sp. LBB02]|nr:acyltransferase [Candidatus Magnetominusculus sp. LBB02]